MALSAEEQEELDYLRELQQNISKPMMNNQYNRIRYLTLKGWHNHCSKTNCTGFEGTDLDLICPKCGSELVKMETL